jgi:hypothetical protein
MITDNVFVIAGLAACIIAIGLMAAVVLRDRRKKPKTKWEEVGPDRIPF